MRILVEAIFILTEGGPVPNVRRGRKKIGFSVPDDQRVYHQLRKEDVILCDQAEKLLYTAMKQLMPTYYDGREENLYLVPPKNKLFL